MRTRRRPAAAEQVAEEALAEDIAEGLEDVAHVAEVRRLAALKPRESEAVVLRPLLRVAEHLEGLGRLLELDDRLVVARIAVGVILQRQLAIGLGDLLLARGALDPSTS